MVHKEILATPNLKASQGVFTFLGEATIKAPAKEVYAAIRDFQSYPKWNHYITSIKTPSGTNAIAVGDMITLAYRPEPTGKLMDVPCKITSISDEDMTISWQGRAMSIPEFVLFPEKMHKVIPKGENECVLQIWETQAGPMAYVVKWTMGEKLSAMTQGIVDGLKAYVSE